LKKMLYEKDGDLNLLDGKIVAVIGFGSQGHAHSQNLRDSGVKVVVAEAPGTAAWDRAAAAGFEVMTANAAAAVADVIMMVVPDQTQKVVYETAVRDNLKDGDMLMFAHGFNIHYNQIVPPKTVDVTMIAPKGPGHLVRRVYTEGGGVPALLAVYQDATGKAREKALAYAKGIGALRGE
jgi:ketol-acid reductoisomerase